MVPEPLPPDEGERLAALHRYAVLGTAPEAAFDRVARLAACLLGVPVVVVALVDADRCFFKARLGLDLAQVPREGDFCARAILGDGVMVVEDASLDPRFAGSPLVASAPAIRFCVAAPLRTPDGWRVGALCAMNPAPRRLAPGQAEALADLAALAVDQLERRRQAEERGRSEAILRAALDSLPLEFWVRDRAHRCVLQNPVARALRGDLLGTLPDHPGLPPETAPERQVDGHRALAGATVRGEVVEVVGGAVTILDKIVAPVRGPDGAVLGYLGVNVDVTEQRRTEAALAESEARFRNMADHAPVVIWVAGTDGGCTYLNPRWQELTGQAATEGLGQGWLDCLHPEDRAAVHEVHGAALAARAPSRTEYRLRRPDGGWRWVIDAGAPRFDDAGAFLGYVGTLVDITERRQAEAAASAAAERTALALAAGRMGTWDWDVASDRLVWDEQECRLFGLAPGEGPTTGAAFLALVHPGDRAMLLEAGQRAERTGEGFDGEYRILLPDGTVRWFAERCTAIRGAGGRLVRMTGVNYDVTERKLVEERVRELAMRDPLTGLPNRRTLREVLARELARAGRAGAERAGDGPALLLVDLDQFKRVNDTLGHPAGDEMLVEATRRLRACVREADVVARLGGDEFAVVATDARGPEDLAALAGRLVAVLAEPFRLGGGEGTGGIEVAGGGSVGVAAGVPAADGADELLARADLALYAAKEAGRGTWRFFSPALQAEAREAATLDRDLRRALERGEFALHYQPVVRVDDLGPWAIEALLRWRHPERGLVEPAAFLAAAERGRLIVPLTFWTFTEALRQAAAWRATGACPLPVAVNVAVSVLGTEGLVEHVAGRLRAEGLPGDALLVEVSEGVMAEGGKVVAALSALRRRGVRVAVDDFGAGCSSLGRLCHLPLDVLKLDRTFLATAEGERGEAILRAMVALARGLELPTVVEGVETAEQLGLLRRVGADSAQGFLIARPMPAEAVPAWAAAWGDGRLGDPCLDLLRRAGG